MVSLASRVALFFLTASGSVSATDSHLVSRRFQNPGLQKRFIDQNGNYNITIIHVNDVHAHLDEFTSSGTDCSAGKTCYGGYARLKTKITQLRQQYNDSLLINAGDEFQGTLFFSYLGPSVIAETLNDVGFDAMTLGNHEFDKGEEPLVGFIKNLTFPMICANINSTNTALQQSLLPYKVFPQHSLAIVGVTTPDTPGISQPGAGTLFLNPVTTVQQTVDRIKASENVTRFVVITHIGYEADIELAKNTRGVHLVIGGHSHTLLGNFTGSSGAYPTIQTNLDGEEVFIVTAFKWGQYLGKIDVAYDPKGKIVSYTGSPILMDNSTAQEPKLQAQVKQWRVPFDDLGKQVVATTSVALDQSTCQQNECTLGDAVSDAMLDYRVKAGASVDGAIVNAGGIRASIDVGEVTRAEVLTAFPFLNGVVELTFTGQQLWDAFEGIVSRTNKQGQNVTSGVQISKGMQITYNPNNPVGSRLISFSIGQANPVPPVNLTKTYRIVTIDFLATGGDFFWPKRTDFVTLDTLDSVFTNYIASNSPFSIQTTGRMLKTEETKPRPGQGASGSSAMPLGIGIACTTIVVVMAGLLAVVL